MAESEERRSSSPKREPGGEYDSARKSKFRFKSKSSSSRRHHRDRSPHRSHRSSHHSRSRSRSRSPSRHRSHHRSHHSSSSYSKRSRHHHKSSKSASSSNSNSRLKDNPADYDDTYIPNCRTFNFADPESSFRESLFDAMADDEGADFWEGVYGQPIHDYSRPEHLNEQGELEAMNDDEYAAYVRGKMYEKSHEHIIKERERREEERVKKKKQEEEERKAWQQREYERLLREKERRQKKRSEGMKNRWKEYESAWSEISMAKKKDGTGSGTDKEGKVVIPWPVDSGSRRDVSKENVEEFFKAATAVATGGDGKPMSMADILRIERIRWHPDKALQRWGTGNLRDEQMKSITAVFQVVDSLWADVKTK